MAIGDDKQRSQHEMESDLDVPSGGSVLIADEQLRQKAALVELSYEPIIVWDFTDGILEWNRGAENLYGYTQHEAVGRISHDLLQTVHPIPLDEFLDTLIREGIWSGELRHFTKDGREVVIESRQQILETNGRRLVLESARDITGRQATEAMLERYRLLFERSRDVIWFLRSDLSFVDVNQAAIDTYGYSRDEFQELSLTDIRHAETLSTLAEQLELADADSIHFETVHVRKDGTSFPVDVTANVAIFGGDRLIMAIVRDITERKEAELALLASEERSQLAQRAGRVGIWDWEAATNETYWSDSMWSFYGGEANDTNPDEEFWSRHLHPSDRERVQTNIRRVLESRDDQFHDEFRIVQADGSVRWIESTATVTRDPSGTATRMYGVNMDVTGRKETEERVKLSENQLKLVTNALPALISYVDSSERYRFVNQRFTEWFGLSGGELVGKRVRDVFGMPAYRVLKPFIDKVLAGEQCTFETALSYKYGGDRYVHVSYMPDFGVDGTVYGYYGLTHDLTDLKRSQDLLRSTEDRMSLVMENLKDYVIFSMDRHGIIDSWNLGGEHIFGYTPDEIIGQSCEILFTPEDRAAGIPSKEMRGARQKGRASDDRWHLRKDGTRFFANGLMMPLYLESGLAGYAKIATDLTEKHRRAEELQRAHDELELRVEERTRALAESNLALIQEMETREETERERIALLGRLVTSQEYERRRLARDLHDQLGQRLTALRLEIASLKELSLEHEEISGRVQRLQETAEQLDSEVSFLAWELRPTALDDLGLMNAVGAFVNEWSKHFDIAGDFYSGGLAKARLDHDTETHLYRITQEALNNITKHAQAKCVTVLLEQRDENVLLIIEDDGIGFDPSIERVSSESGGGLGLVGMKERATLVGGEVQVESAPGKGTTIFVRVPVSV